MPSVPAAESSPAMDHGNADLRSPPLPDLRTPVSRGASTLSGLETVEESSMPSTPSIGPLLNAIAESKIDAAPLDEHSESSSQRSLQKVIEGVVTGAEGSQKPAIERGDSDSKSKATPTVRPANNLARRSFTSLTASKIKAAEPLRTMTVETETVPSIPQIISGERGTSGRDGSGSVRTKPSTETIRPKKEKRKPTRKTLAPQAGTGA